MRSPLRTLPWDLRNVALWALVALAASALPLPSWLRFVLLLPLVLFLPGYAITAAAFPRGVPHAETIVYALAFSLCAAILGGVLTQVLLPLTAAVWALLLTAITLLACLVAAGRRGLGGIPSPGRPSLPSVGAPAAALAALALALTAWSVVLATDGAHDQADAARFTSLWIDSIPGEEGDGVVVGVENQESAETSYKLVVTARGEGKARRIGLRLADGQTRTVELGLWSDPAPKGTVAKLYRDGELYRQVRLSPENPL